MILALKAARIAKTARAWIKEVDADTKLAAMAVSICVYLFTTFSTISYVEGKFNAVEAAEEKVHAVMARAQAELKSDIRSELREIKDSVKTTEERVFIMYTRERKPKL